ncbi:MAG: prenyltransferase [Polyangiales bacterium]
MISSEVNGMKSWIQAARPLAHVNIAIPLALGQAAAWHVTGRFRWWWFGAALVWGVIDHLFVIFANDFADRYADTGRRTPFSGGSGVIPEGKLSAAQLARAARGAAASLMAYSCALMLLGRILTPLYGIAALLLLWLYSFEPARLSYRGGGELLQGIGLGIGLPSLGYYLQTQQMFAPVWILAPATTLGICGNVLTSLPDIEDDARANKKTWPVRHGMTSARRFASAGIAFASFAVFLWTPSVSMHARAAVSIAPLLPLLAGARSDDPYRAAWWSSVALNALVVLWISAMVLGL